MMNRVLLVSFVFATLASCVSADTIEFLSGAKISGVVKEIRKSEKEFDFEASLGSRATIRTYPFDKVHAVTMKGSRFTLNPMPDATSSSTDSDGNIVRTRAQIEKLINTVGSTMPDWYESTELDYPPTLDLSWPIKPPEKGWNNRKNMGQYIWDIINPNTSRWRGGIKLVHHCMTLHQSKSELLRRDMQVTGRMYFDLLQDYPRAAYWLRKAGVTKGQGNSVMLAECYWRMGSRQMAMQQLIVPSRSYAGGAVSGTVKLYGNMGAISQALKLTESIANSTVAERAFIAAGDALRQAGQFDKAIEYYKRVLASNSFRNKDYEQRFKARARESIEAIELFEKVDVSSIDDGDYTGSSTGYNGQLDVLVKVAGSKIESVKVTQHREKQFYSALTDTENQIIQRQSVRGVDGTSGATITSRAIVNAAAKALASGSR
jgi:uncharacterized protein with FMN-binding domain